MGGGTLEAGGLLRPWRSTPGPVSGVRGGQCGGAPWCHGLVPCTCSRRAPMVLTGGEGGVVV